MVIRVVVISFAVHDVDIRVHERDARFVELEGMVSSPRVDFVFFEKEIIVGQFRVPVVRAGCQRLFSLKSVNSLFPKKRAFLSFIALFF